MEPSPRPAGRLKDFTLEGLLDCTLDDGFGDSMPLSSPLQLVSPNVYSHKTLRPRPAEHCGAGHGQEASNCHRDASGASGGEVADGLAPLPKFGRKVGSSDFTSQHCFLLLRPFLFAPFLCVMGGAATVENTRFYLLRRSLWISSLYYTHAPQLLHPRFARWIPVD